MAQHDYVIDNQTAPNFRADLNNALSAIVSNNSGPSAPSDTYANMMWYDTTNNILKMRNEADDAWINIGTLNQTTDEFFPNGAVPPGSVIYHAASAPPAGYLKANGAAVSRSTYSSLFSTIGTTFGSGNGSTTFNLPDLRGEFLRGWDDARGVDSGRGFGSYQADAFKAHTHRANNNFDFIVGQAGGGRYGPGSIGGFANGLTTEGGSETRPRNRALLACIKF